MAPDKKLITAYVVAAVMLFIIIITAAECNKVNKQIKTIKDTKTIMATPPKQYTDAGGTIHTQQQVAVADQQTLELFYKKQIDSLTKLVKAKPSSVAAVGGIGTTAAGKVTVRIDTVYQDVDPGEADIEVSYNDGWLSFGGFVDEKDSWKYQYKDSVTLLAYWKKQGLFKPKALVIDGFSHNPNSKITGLSAVKVTSAPVKRWGVGPNISAQLSGGKLVIQPGIGIQYNLIRF